MNRDTPTCRAVAGFQRAIAHEVSLTRLDERHPEGNSRWAGGGADMVSARQEVAEALRESNRLRRVSKRLRTVLCDESSGSWRQDVARARRRELEPDRYAPQAPVSGSPAD